MTAALSLARRGFAVTLIEREPLLGGLLRHLDKLYPTHDDARSLVERCEIEVREHPHVEVLTEATVQAVKGHIGNYELTVHSTQFGLDLPVQAGVIVVATGAEELKPLGLYGYGYSPKVVTQQELEHHLAPGTLESRLSDRQSPTFSIFMIQTSSPSRRTVRGSEMMFFNCVPLMTTFT